MPMRAWAVIGYLGSKELEIGSHEMKKRVPLTIKCWGEHLCQIMGTRKASVHKRNEKQKQSRSARAAFGDRHIQT
eukprot:2127772-Rhodomonas_salina.2